MAFHCFIHEYDIFVIFFPLIKRSCVIERRMREVGKTKGRARSINVKFNFPKCFPTQSSAGG